MSPQAAFAPRGTSDGHIGRLRITMTMRITATLLGVALLTQAVTAGLLLSIPGGRELHSTTVVFVMLAAVAQLVAAILVWRPGAGSPRSAITSALLLIFLLAEVVAGGAGLTALHVPLGAALLATSAVLAFQTWSR